MNYSKGWRLSLFAIAAVVGLSACGEKKKKKAVSPYTGIWINQRNIQEYSAHRAELNAGNYSRFCMKVYDNPARYGDSEYRVRGLSIQPNGEVYRYSAGESATTLGYREGHYIGSVNPAGQFTGGRIGPDGRVNAQAFQEYAYGSEELPGQTTFSVSPVNRNLMRVFSSQEISFMERHSRTVADEYTVHVTVCLTEVRRWHSSNGAGRSVPQVNLGLRRGGPACDPRIRPCGPGIRDPRRAGVDGGGPRPELQEGDEGFDNGESPDFQPEK